jgi:hypothetical protein
VGRKADIDGQHPQLLQQLKQALFGGDRERDDEEVEPRAPRELDELVDIAELGVAGYDGRDTIVAAVVENADDADIGVLRGFERLDQLFGLVSTADDHGAAVEAALLGPALRQQRQSEALAEQRRQRRDVPGGDPHPREVSTDLDEEGERHHAAHDQGPAEGKPRETSDEGAKGRHAVEIEQLEHHRVRGGCDQHGAEIDEVHLRAFAIDISKVNDEAKRRYDEKLDHAHGAGHHDRRQEIEVGVAPDLGEPRARRAAPLGERCARLGAPASPVWKSRLLRGHGFGFTHLLTFYLAVQRPRPWKQVACQA